jgi:DNA helicase IV
MHPDVPEEQAYFDRALELRDRVEANLSQAADEAADPRTARDLRRRVGALGVVDPSVAVAFGRIDVNGSQWYIGKGAIWDEDNELVVVNWQAPIAAPFYRATPDEPEGIEARRIYRCAPGNRIRDIEEQVFEGLRRAIVSHTGPVPPVAEPTGRPTPAREPTPAVATEVLGPHGSAVVPVSSNGTGSHAVVRHTGPVDVAFGSGARKASANGSVVSDPTPSTGVSVVQVPAERPPGPASPAPASPAPLPAGKPPVPPAESAPASPPEPQVSDALLAALSQSRTGELTEIVATIQSAQYDVITRDVEQLLVIQGGPGTGKTVVGLHRASWMLYHRRDSWQPNDVLIVGPNPAFIRYISSVLPSLGDDEVVQLPVTGLGPRAEVTRVDSLEVRRLKGDRRMQRLLLRAVRNRQKSQRGPVDLTVAGRTVRVDGGRVAARAAELAGQPHNEVRRALRAFVVEEVQTFFGRRGLRGLSGIDDVAQAEATRDIDDYLERIWPAMTPQRFLVDLFSTRRRLEAAGVGLLTNEEISMLSMPDTQPGEAAWAEDDVPLLDLADTLLNGVPATYEHIIVDEAQDLSPMQFEAIRRRSRTGWMTVLGDLAQATSPWSPESWEEAVLLLRHDRVPTEIVELSYGYRLPREVHDLAVRLLPEIAPRLRTPDPLRVSGHQVRVLASHRGELPWRVTEEVEHLLVADGLGPTPAPASGGLIGIIVPERERDALHRALDRTGLDWADELAAEAAPIVVLAARDAKGLEFDNVIVVEPGEVAGESPQGLRALFVALTRTTNRLSLVHAEPLPSILEVESPLPTEPPPTNAHAPTPALAAPAPEVPAADVPAVPSLAASPWEPVTAPPAPLALPPRIPSAPATPPSGVPPMEPYAVSGSLMQLPEPVPIAAAPQHAVAPPPPPGELDPEPGPAGGADGSAPKHAAGAPGGLETIDRAMARAVAGQLADALARYVTPSLVPLVLEELAAVLEERGAVQVLDVRQR